MTIRYKITNSGSNWEYYAETENEWIDWLNSWSGGEKLYGTGFSASIHPVLKTKEDAIHEGKEYLNKLGWNADVREITRDLNTAGLLTVSQSSIYLSNLIETKKMYDDAINSSSVFNTGSYNIIDYITFNSYN